MSSQVLFFCLISAFVFICEGATPCPSGWTHYEPTNKCYYVTPTMVPNKSFLPALLSCARKQATLVIPRSAGENDFVAGLLEDRSAWIGYAQFEYDLPIASIVDGSGVTYENWSNLGKTIPCECAVLRADTKTWGCFSCYTRNAAAVCERNAESYPDPERHQPSCPNKWRFHEGKCYKATRKMKNFEEAKQQCEKQGASLAMPMSKGDNTFLGKMLGDKFGYLGLKAIGSTAVGINNNSPVPFQNWSNQGISIPCACILLIPDNSQWACYPCAIDNAIALCEKSAQ